jgi:hypothetical protein
VKNKEVEEAKEAKEAEETALLPGRQKFLPQRAQRPAEKSKRSGKLPDTANTEEG